MPNIEPDYGVWYNWGACVHPNGICPTGFKVPSKQDFDVLVEEVGSHTDFIVGDFSASLSGLWYGNTSGVGSEGVFHSTTEDIPIFTNFQLKIGWNYDDDDFFEANTIAAGCAVRCLKD